MEENQLWFLIARHLSGEISPDESNTLQELLKKHPDKHHLFDILQSYFILPDDAEIPAGDSGMNDELRFRRIIEHNEPTQDINAQPLINPVIIRDRRRIWRYAAAVACVVVAGGVGFNYFHQPAIKPEHAAVRLESPAAKGNEIISRSG